MPVIGATYQGGPGGPGNQGEPRRRGRSSARRRPAKRRRASSRCRATCSRPTTSTRTRSSGPIRATSAATRRVAIEDMWTQRGAIGDERPDVGGLGTLRQRLSARSDREPVSVQDGARALGSAESRDDETRRPDEAHVRDRARRRVDGPLRPRLDRKLVPGAQDAGPDDAVAADAEVSDLPRAGGLSRGQHERLALAVAVLLARGVHAALAPGRDSRPLRHGDAAAGPDHDRHRAQLRDQHPHRPRVRHVGRDSAARRRRAALVRRDDRLLGRRHADHVDVERHRLEGAQPRSSTRTRCRRSRSTRRTATRAASSWG